MTTLYTQVCRTGLGALVLLGLVISSGCPSPQINQERHEFAQAVKRNKEALLARPDDREYQARRAEASAMADGGSRDPFLSAASRELPSPADTFASAGAPGRVAAIVDDQSQDVRRSRNNGLTAIGQTGVALAQPPAAPIVDANIQRAGATVVDGDFPDQNRVTTLLYEPLPLDREVRPSRSPLDEMMSSSVGDHESPANNSIQQLAYTEAEPTADARPFPTDSVDPLFETPEISNDDEPLTRTAQLDVEQTRFAPRRRAAKPFPDVCPPDGSISHDACPRVLGPGEVACPPTCPTGDCRNGSCPGGNCPGGNCQPGGHPGGLTTMISGPRGLVPIDPTAYPDEYICDGGDRGEPFHYEGYDRGGIDTEDTVGEYRDERGKAHSTVSSKVCIYAPRFAAMRSQSGPISQRDVNRIAGIHDGSRVAGIDTKLGIEEGTQRDAMLRLDTTARASGVLAEASDGGIAEAHGAKGYEERLISYQSLSFIQDGRVRTADEAVLSYGVKTAGLWTREQNPIIAARDSSGHELEAEFNPREIVGVEDKRAFGQLRIVKLADKETARPGDIISFTIRFDNLGQRDLRDISITDNLTPRLEYIADSASMELDGDGAFDANLEATPNGEGSMVLQITLKEPLKGKQGGFVTFKCRVR